MILFIILNTSLPQNLWAYFKQISFEKLIWRDFSSLVLNMNKMLHYSTSWTHIKLYHVELLLARYYQFYLCRGQFHQSPAYMTEDWQLQTSLHNWTNVMKKCINIYCQETTVEEVKLLKDSNGPKCTKTWQ